MNRIPTLDGWRGIAILLVLFDHTQRALMGRYLEPWSATGQHGVTVFFVLSGFLITTKLLEGPTDLKKFYVRRFFRLLPAAWAYLAVIWLLGLLCGQNWFSSREIASCLLFYRNFIVSGPQSFFTTHYWSLSVEEQFYIAWPSLLLLAGIRKARWLAAGGAIACALYRHFNWNYYDRMGFSFETQVRADALLIGCLMALWFSAPANRAAAVKWSAYCAAPALAVLLYCIAFFQWLPPLAESVAIAMLIAASVFHPGSFLARPLSWRPLAWLGTVSYSLYVWQQFFFAERSHSVTIGMICVMPLFALGSYYLIERPATRLGHRLTTRKVRTTLVSNPQAVFTEA